MKTILSMLVTVIVVISCLLDNVSCKNTTQPSVTDPLQRVMQKFNLYQDEVADLMKQLEEKGHPLLIQWLKSVFSPRRTLLVIDMQNDFIDGSLAVPGAEEILDKVEDLTNLDIWYQVLYTQDWHPKDHISFFSNLGLRQLDPTWLSINNISNVNNIKMFDEVTFKRYPPYKQRLWPDHCIQDSEGAKFHSSLTQPKRSQVIKKGTNPLIDAYSAFFDNTDIKGSGDTGLRRLVEDSTEIVVVGLAQDYCVAWTCLDSLGLRLPTTILTDHTRPVDPDTGDQMMERVRDAGGIVTTLRDYQDELEEWSKAKEIAHFLIQNSALPATYSLQLSSLILSVFVYSRVN